MAFLSDPNMFPTIYVLSNVWQGTGWGSIIYLATLSGVDEQLHEAAIIDGANRFQRMIHISIPYIVPTMIILLILNSASISDPNLVNTGKVFLFPKGIMFDGYRRILRQSSVWVGYRNSIMYTILGTAINLIITLPGAYALSRKDTPMRGFFSKLFLFTMFFSGGLIPTYMLVRGLGLRDTIWSVILPVGCSTYNLIVTRTYFVNSVSGEIEEAAEIDGCSIFQLFFRIVLPLSSPIIAVMAWRCSMAWDIGIATLMR